MEEHQLLPLQPNHVIHGHHHDVPNGPLHGQPGAHQHPQQAPGAAAALDPQHQPLDNRSRCRHYVLFSLRLILIAMLMCMAYASAHDLYFHIERYVNPPTPEWSAIDTFFWESSLISFIQMILCLIGIWASAYRHLMTVGLYSGFQAILFLYEMHFFWRENLLITENLHLPQVLYVTQRPIFQVACMVLALFLSYFK